MNIYPWQLDTWNSLMSLRQRLPHALLLQGRAGIGKAEFARNYAQSMLCDTPDAAGHACGTCQSCNWFAQGNHPDFRLLEPEDDPEGKSDADAGAEYETEAARQGKARKKSLITVPQVRALGDFLGLSTHRQGLRIVLLQPAESLNASSANALLKMLEEPPPASLFLLVTSQPQRLLPTIRSRCQKIIMSPPARKAAEDWLAVQQVPDFSGRLAYAGGSPLTALASDELQDIHRQFTGLLRQGAKLDPVAAAAAHARDGIGEIIAALQKWAYDLLALKMLGKPRYHQPPAASMQALADGVDLYRLLDYQRLLGEARKLAQHPLNAELQLEALLIQYVSLFQPQRKP